MLDIYFTKWFNKIYLYYSVIFNVSISYTLEFGFTLIVLKKNLKYNEKNLNM